MQSVLAIKSHIKFVLSKDSVHSTEKSKERFPAIRECIQLPVDCVRFRATGHLQQEYFRLTKRSKVANTIRPVSIDRSIDRASELFSSVFGGVS